MRRIWGWWVARCDREGDARPLAMVRILAPLAAAADLIQVARLGLVETIFRTYAHGGISVQENPWAKVDDWISPEGGGLVAWWVAVISLLMASVGVAARPALLVGVLAWAQLGHLCGPSDRGVDRILRTMLLILVFSQAHRCLALMGRPHRAKIPLWPADLIRYLLAIIYFASGVSKLMSQPGWLAWSGAPVLYRIVSDPTSAHMDAAAMEAWYWPLRILGWGTIALELSAPLVLTRWAPWWALGGVGMHLGIAMTMELGVFPWGMLALYPVLFAPWFERLWGRRG